MRPERVFLIAALTLGLATGLAAQSLNIDFGTATAPEAGLAPPSFGGAAGQTGSWNQVGLGNVPNLLGLGGAPSSVSISVTGQSAAGFPPTGDVCTGDFGLLMNDNFYTSDASTVVLSGLVNGTYTVYFYDPGHSGVATGDIDANGVLVPSLNESPVGCVFVAGTNYAAASVPVTSGTMTIQLTLAAGENFTGLAGLQLVQEAVVEPVIPALGPWGIALLAALVLAAALFALRRLM